MRIAAGITLAAIVATPLLTGCRGCGAATNDAPTTETTASPSASVSSALGVEPPPPGRPMATTLVPGSWKKGHLPPVVPPATSSTVPTK